MLNTVIKLATTPRLPTARTKKSQDFQASNTQGSTSSVIAYSCQGTSTHKDSSSTGTSNSNEEVLIVLRSFQYEATA